MAISFNTSALTLRETFSFYVSGRDLNRILECAEQADAIVVSGVNGPTSVRQLRDMGWTGAVLFDRVGYNNRQSDLDSTKWLEEQQAAGADRLLTPGCWVGSSAEHESFASQVEVEVKTAVDNGATCLLAIDYRWLTQSPRLNEMLQVLEGLNAPVAVVLGDRNDPLAHRGAVEGLAALSARVRGLTILRCDQGGIGALAFGASHAAIGLSATHRHTVPPGVESFAKRNDFTARVFIPELMDWFTAGTVAGWSTASATLNCLAPCCDGQPIVRFFDDRLKIEADLHNRTVIAALADEVLSAPEEDGVRRTAFSQMCRDALVRYGPMGSWMTEIKPKPQLRQWALY